MAAKRLKTRLIVMSIVGTIALLGVIFLILAGYIFAAQKLGPLAAALWFGGVLVGIAIVVYLVYRVTARLREKREARRRKAELSSMAIATALALLPALPALATRKGVIGALVTPLVAAVGYQIYKENSRGRSGGLADHEET